MDLMKKVWKKDEVLTRLGKLKQKRDALELLGLTKAKNDFETQKIDRDIEAWKKRYQGALE